MLHEEKSTIYRTLPFKVDKADTFGSRLKGLMFRRKPLEEEGLWIIPCNSIHMCFMSFSIDVVFLNANNEIIKLVREIRPWKFVMPVKDAVSVLELPVGTIDLFSLRVGERLTLSRDY